MVSARASTWARSKIICSRIQKAGVLPMDFDSLTAISGDIQEMVMGKDDAIRIKEHRLKNLMLQVGQS
jgi:hypothetical protein